MPWNGKATSRRNWRSIAGPWPFPTRSASPTKRSTSPSRSGANAYALRVFGDAEPREGLRKGDTQRAPPAVRVVRADLAGEIAGVEPDFRKDAGHVRLRDLRRQTVVIRAESFPDVEETRQGERPLPDVSEL